MEQLQLLNKIKFNKINKRPNINEKELTIWLQKVIKLESMCLSRIEINFCDDAYLLDLNILYLNHNYLTDILTFDLSDVRGTIDGDIYISIDRVKDNSLELHIPFKTELSRVIVHGVLHLCGFADKNVGEKKIMRTRENFYLAMLPCST